MEIRSVHHVAMAVADLDGAIETYRRLFGAEVELREKLEAQGVEAVYLDVGGARVELLMPLDDATPVGRFLAKRGPGMHHVAFEVTQAASALRELDQAGAELIDPELREGLAGHRVAFVHPDSVHGVLVEVVSDGG
jgi:methylmalonyl-CoA/ethylmalonyl-CoA epimerase